MKKSSVSYTHTRPGYRDTRVTTDNGLRLLTWRDPIGSTRTWQDLGSPTKEFNLTDLTVHPMGMDQRREIHVTLESSHPMESVWNSRLEPIGGSPRCNGLEDGRGTETSAIDSHSDTIACQNP